MTTLEAVNRAAVRAAAARAERPLAEAIMVVGDHLVHLDGLRGDLAGGELRAVPATLAPTTPASC